MRSFSLSPVSVIAPKREAKGHCDKKRALFSGVGGRMRNSLSAACIDNDCLKHLPHTQPLTNDSLLVKRREAAARARKRTGDGDGLLSVAGRGQRDESPQPPSAAAAADDDPVHWVNVRKKWFRIKSGEACSKIVIFNMHSFQTKQKQSSKNDAEPIQPLRGPLRIVPIPVLRKTFCWTLPPQL